MSLNQSLLQEYYDCVGGLLLDERVLSMRGIRHHFVTSCYDHSVFVSYVAFRLAKRFGLDCTEAARAGLLHDLYLYDPRDKSNYSGNQCFAHPVAALQNAMELCGDLSRAERNTILSHMWPLSRYAPKYKVAFIVNLADKFCATVEVCRLYGRLRRRNKVPVPA